MGGRLKRLLKRSNLVVRLVRFVRRRLVWPLRRRGIIRRYLATNEVRKLLLGAGPTGTLEGWLNTDMFPVHGNGVAYLDATSRFPHSDATFDYIQSEHMIEHLDYAEGLAMLQECFRVLKPGGRIRIATPDLNAYLEIFRPDKTDLQKRFIEHYMNRWSPGSDVPGPCFVLNNLFRSWGHRFLYDRETLAGSLEATGFVALTDFKPGESDVAALRGIELHGKAIDSEEMNRFETMVIEAQKPD